MSEKRFKYKITDGFFDGDVLISIKEVVELLNEQQATISALKEENEQLKKELKWKREEIKALIEESERDE